MYQVNGARAQLAESCVPPIQGGEYTLCASYESPELGAGSSEKQRLVVEGRRFLLTPQEIQSVYPPENMTGGFGLTLPHIVFSQMTLPWERPIHEPGGISPKDGVAPAMEAPWIALLLLCGDEITELGTIKAGDLKPGPDSGVYFPNLAIRADEQEESCSYMDLDAELFGRIGPRLEELTFLCHARKAEMDKKADNTACAACLVENGGWHSVVIGSRLPPSSREGVRCRACAISLEGYGNYLEHPQETGAEKVRLVVLYSWDFISVTEHFQMEAQFEGLSKGRLSLPSQGFTGEAREILKRGYVPVPHVLRNGEQTVSFYRGAFSPVLPQKTVGAAMSADSLYRYDPENGMFDISYGAAWQMGRLLALSSQSIASGIMEERKKNYRLAHRRLTQEMMGVGDGTPLGRRMLDFMEASLNDMLTGGEKEGER